jgi:hypothetical protein
MLDFMELWSRVSVVQFVQFSDLFTPCRDYDDRTAFRRLILIVYFTGFMHNKFEFDNSVLD